MFRFYIIHLPLTRIRIVLIMSLINKYPVFVNMPSSHFKRISKASERVPVQVPNMFAFERDRHRVRILISTRRTTLVNISKIQQL